MALELRYRHPQIQPVPHISEKSRRLALQRRPQLAQQPVHIRLYQQELEKTKFALAKQQQNEQEMAQYLRKQQMLKSPSNGGGA